MFILFRSALLIAVAASLALLPTGCGGRDTELPDFTWLIGAEPETIDPGLVSGQPGGRVARNIFEGLTYHGPKLEIEPGVAESWDLSPDGRVYTFHLRENARWSDGKPVTAGDFAYSWERVLRPATAAKYANMLFPIRNAQAYNRGDITDPEQLGFRAVDDLTFEVTLHSPCAYFLDLCAFYTMLPVPRWVVETYDREWIKPENIVSNGPFVMEEWLLNRKIRMRKNSYYWGAESVTLEIADAIPSDNINANFNLYMSGVADWGDASAVPLYVIPELMKRDDFHIAPYFNTYFYRYSVNRPPFDDVRVRRAFSLAMNRSDIVKYVTRAGEAPAYGLVPPGIPGYTEARIPEENVEEARRLMAEAGYPGGKGFPHAELLFNTSESHKQVAEVVQQQWKEALGVQVELVNQEWKVYLATTLQLDYWVARAGWIGDYLDPNTYLDMWTTGNGNNRTGFASAEYDALIARAARELDPVRRMEMLHEAEDWVINREAIIIPIYTYVVKNLYDPLDFEGLEPNLLNLVNLRTVKPLRGHRGRPRDAHPRPDPVAVAGPGDGE